MSQQQNGVDEESGLAHIKLNSDSPFPLFREWHRLAKSSDIVQPDSLTLATTTREGKVTARTVLLRRLEPDGFVIMTDRRSRKARDLAEVPAAAMVFLWNYVKDGEKINSQVRVEGTIVQLEPHEYQDLYDSEPLFCKMRSHLCHQGSPVDWTKHKARHDELLSQWRGGENSLAMPDHFVAYKLIADVMEFYYAWGNMIGDRILFLLDQATKTWKHQRIAA